MPKLNCNPLLFKEYVGFFSGYVFPRDNPVSAMFYRHNAEYLALLKQEKKEFTELILPVFMPSVLNPSPKYESLISEPFEEDGVYLIDPIRGIMLLRFKERGEEKENVNWNQFKHHPDPTHKKTLAILWSDADSATPYIMFADTYAPSMFTWVNYRYNFIAPTTETASLIGLSAITQYILKKLKLPALPINTLSNNLKEMSPTSPPRLKDSNVAMAYSMIQELDFGDDDDYLGNHISSLSRETVIISPKELMNILQSKSYKAELSTRYVVKTRKYKTEDYLIVFTFERLFFHILSENAEIPSIKTIRRALSFPRKLPIDIMEDWKKTEEGGDNDDAVS